MCRGRAGEHFVLSAASVGFSGAVVIFPNKWGNSYLPKCITRTAYITPLRAGASACIGYIEAAAELYEEVSEAEYFKCMQEHVPPFS